MKMGSKYQLTNYLTRLVFCPQSLDRLYLCFYNHSDDNSRFPSHRASNIPRKQIELAANEPGDGLAQTIRTPQARRACKLGMACIALLNDDRCIIRHHGYANAHKRHRHQGHAFGGARAGVGGGREGGQLPVAGFSWSPIIGDRLTATSEHEGAIWTLRPVTCRNPLAILLKAECHAHG